MNLEPGLSTLVAHGADGLRVSAAELLGRLVSLFTSCRSKEQPQLVTLARLLDDIKGSRWRSDVDQIRGAASKREADALKEKLPAAKFSGEFRGLSASDLIRHSGLLALDVDGVPEPAMRGLRLTLADDAHVLAFFRSPGGRGLKILVPVQARDGDAHQRCFDSARTHFAPLLPAGAVFDQQPRSVAANCFVSNDTELWLTSEPRRVFGPAVAEGGENTPLLPRPTPKAAEEGVPSQKTVGQTYIYRSPPPPPGFGLPSVVDVSVWGNWVKRVPYRPGGRNAAIIGRVPLLLNIVAPQNAALLLLRWFDQAPPGMFKDSRAVHWDETIAAIKGCLQSWPTNRKVGLSKKEREAYNALRDDQDDRQRATFRICRSLSLAADNRASRTFQMSDGSMAERLGCPLRGGARQLEYLTRNRIIEIIEPGQPWAKKKDGVKFTPRATSYRWLLR